MRDRTVHEQPGTSQEHTVRMCSFNVAVYMHTWIKVTTLGLLLRSLALAGIFPNGCVHGVRVHRVRVNKSAMAVPVYIDVVLVAAVTLIILVSIWDVVAISVDSLDLELSVASAEIFGTRETFGAYTLYSCSGGHRMLGKLPCPACSDVYKGGLVEHMRHLPSSRYHEQRTHVLVVVACRVRCTYDCEHDRTERAQPGTSQERVFACAVLMWLYICILGSR